MHVLVTDYDYELREKSYCDPVFKQIMVQTLSEAKYQCSNDPSCAMFNWAWKHPDIGFLMCGSGANITTYDLDETRLYIKKSEYICIGTFFCNAISHNMV